MVRFIPFEQKDPDENRSNADAIQQVHLLKAIEDLLVVYGMNYLPPDNIDLDDEEKLEQDNFKSATIGLADAIANHIEDAVEPSNTLRITLGHMFISRGHQSKDFEEKLSHAVELISEFCEEAQES